MRNTILLLVYLCMTIICHAQIIMIPDNAFKRALLAQGIDENGDGNIQKTEAQKLTVLYVAKQGIKSLEGIEQFTNLAEFGCNGNELTKLNLSALKKLQYLYAYDNMLESININGLNALKHIYIQNNPYLFVNIDFSQFSNLEELYIKNDRVLKLNLTNLKKLKIIEASSTGLSDLQISGSENLTQIWLENNQLVFVDFKQLEKIEFLTLSNNPLQSIDIRQLKKLRKLSCLDCNALKQINTSGCENLEPIIW